MSISRLAQTGDTTCVPQRTTSVFFMVGVSFLVCFLSRSFSETRFLSLPVLGDPLDRGGALMRLDPPTLMDSVRSGLFDERVRWTSLVAAGEADAVDVLLLEVGTVRLSPLVCFPIVLPSPELFPEGSGVGESGTTSPSLSTIRGSQVGLAVDHCVSRTGSAWASRRSTFRVGDLKDMEDVDGSRGFQSSLSLFTFADSEIFGLDGDAARGASSNWGPSVVKPGSDAQSRIFVLRIRPATSATICASSKGVTAVSSNRCRSLSA
jgi:hypothetical protein